MQARGQKEAQVMAEQHRMLNWIIPKDAVLMSVEICTLQIGLTFVW